MAVPESLRWLLSLTLVGATVFHLGRLAWPGVPSEQRIAESLHAVMGVAMVAMLWPFGRAVPAAAWPVVFAGSAGWFAAQACRADGRRLVPAFFASAAAAMVWMSEAMPAGTAVAMPGMAHSSPSRAAWAGAAIGGYLVAAGVAWVLSGLRLGRLPPATAPAGPARWHWPALCHGAMSVSMGLAMLTTL